MAIIHIKKLGADRFEVTVEANATTTHTVTTPSEYVKTLLRNRLPAGSTQGDDVLVELLLRRSFEFLLERESNTSILRSFDLPMIARYFPEYERVVASMLD